MVFRTFESCSVRSSKTNTCRNNLFACRFGVSVKCGPDGGGWRMADSGMKNADDKMRMIKCGWKILGDKFLRKGN